MISNFDIRQARFNKSIKEFLWKEVPTIRICLWSMICPGLSGPQFASGIGMCEQGQGQAL